MSSGLVSFTGLASAASTVYCVTALMEMPMIFQAAIQAAMRRMRSSLPPPPSTRDPMRPRDRTGLIFVLLMLGIALAFAIAAISP